MERTQTIERTRKLAKKLTGVVPKLVIDGKVEVHALGDYPRPGLTTLFTAGFVGHPGVYRGKPTGWELTLTVPSENDLGLWSQELVNLITFHRKVRAEGMRRSPMEYNGAMAPGYAPHYYFCTQLTLTPDLSDRKSGGGFYVIWVPAIPITDGELRMFDRLPRSLMEHFQETGADLTDWTRR